MTSQFHRFLRWLLFLWVKVEVFPRENPPFDFNTSIPTLYVLADRGLSDLLVLAHTTNALGLPNPFQRVSIPGLGYHDSVYSIASRNPLIDWIRRRKKQPNLLQDFIDALQRGGPVKLQIVPVSVYWGRPVARQKHWLQVLFADTWAVTGKTRKFFTLLIHGRSARLLFSRPLYFEALVSECDYSAEKLHALLLDQLMRQREATFGPRIDNRKVITNAVINSPEVRAEIENSAIGKKLTPSKNTARAKIYCKEIFANCTQLTIELMLRVLNQFWRRFYSGIEIYNVDTIKQTALTHQMVYVPCHRSHVDYLLLSYIIFTENLAIPYIAAGNNLNLPVIGRILRGGGAFFIRRSFKDNPLYAAVMRSYVEQLVKLGVPLEYFVEGGRSRTGRLLQPKLGMLDMTVEAYIKSQARPLAFIPVYIGYEKLIEGGSYLGELYGAKKKSESLAGAVRAFTRLRGDFGRVTASFGEPIILSELLDQAQSDWSIRADEIGQKPYWYRNVINRLSRKIMTGINHAAVINPVNMIATVLLATPRQSIDLIELTEQSALYRQLVESTDVLNSVQFTENIDADQIKTIALKKLLNIREHELGDIVFLKPEDSVLMSYYRNNSLHVFIIPALIACCFDNTARVPLEKIVSIIRTLYPFLQAELHLEWEIEELGDLVEKFVNTMVQLELLREGKKGLRRPERSSRRFVDLHRLILIVQPILERYYMTFIVLWQSAKTPMREAELEQRCHLLAQKVSMLHGINAPDFFDRALFRHFIDTMLELDYLMENEDGSLRFSDDFDQINLDIRSLLSFEVRCTILAMIRQ
ncbi:MAG: glycerol-3-phosphate 1-O-acyltransferase PlsB [Gammaproteobacteria bacterium]|nr:glycerol-3-phosphate 1-O-acyltransferase PlsB [Gammaproteobacteria bacterium]